MGYPFWRKSNLLAVGKLSFIPKRNLIWKIFFLEIQTSLLRVGSTGILKLEIRYSQTTPRRSQSGTGFETRLPFQNSLKHFKGSIDLMALDSNVMLARNGTPPPHFSPHPSPQSAGVNLFSQNMRFPPF